jgi:hypothetical protein
MAESAPPIRKRLLESEPSNSPTAEAIDLARDATLLYSSEDPAFPIERILDGNPKTPAARWTSARTDTTETIVIAFDRPHTVSRLVYEVDECDAERTQEMRIEASMDGERTYHQVLIQEYTFSPQGATHELEDLRVDLSGVTHLRLVIIPNKHGSGTATLSTLKLYA